MRPLLRLRRSTTLLQVVRHLQGARPLALRRPGPLPAPHLPSLRPSSDVRRRRQSSFPQGRSWGWRLLSWWSPPTGVAWPSLYNPWTGTIAMWPGQAPRASRPPAPALLTVPPYGVPPTPPYGVPASHPPPPQLLPPGTPTMTWSPLSRGWDNASLAVAFSTMAMTPPSDWVIDSGASYHTTPTTGTLSRSHPPHFSHPSSIVVGNGSTLPVTSVGASVLPGPFYLNDVLVAPHITHNLLSVRRFTTDNSCSIEFDLSGLCEGSGHQDSSRPL
jgi:hypothetical protein